MCSSISCLKYSTWYFLQDFCYLVWANNNQVQNPWDFVHKLENNFQKRFYENYRCLVKFELQKRKKAGESFLPIVKLWPGALRNSLKKRMETSFTKLLASIDHNFSLQHINVRILRMVKVYECRKKISFDITNYKCHRHVGNLYNAPCHN